MPVTRLHVAQAVHESLECGAAARTRRVLLEPFPKSGVERFVFRLGGLPRPLDEMLIGAQSDVFHTKIVYTVFVLRARLA